MGNQQARQQRTRERRQDRAERVLNTTRALVLRWGYRKTTLDDIVSHADIGKGTLFLHWRNRDALFISLLRRENVEMLTEVKEALTADPRGVTVGGFISHYVKAFLARPLVTALFLGDQTTLGRLAEHKRHEVPASGNRLEYANYLTALRERGLVRDDVPVEELVYSFAAIFYGFVAAHSVAPEGFIPSNDRLGELCADNICRALGAETAPGSEAEAAEITERHLDRILSIAQQKYDQSLEVNE